MEEIKLDLQQRSFDKEEFSLTELFLVLCLELERRQKSFLGKKTWKFNSLTEIDFGRYEGIKYEDIDENMRNFFHDPQKFIPMRKMESYTHLFERISHFLDWLKQLEGEGNLLILSHGAAIHAMMNQIYQLKLYDFWKQPIGNCGYFVVEIQDGQFRVVEENFRDGKNNYLKK